MKVFHLLKKTLLRIKTEGFKATMQEFIFIKRVMVVVEKDINYASSNLTDKMEKLIIDDHNYHNYKKRSGLKNIGYYFKRGAQSLILFEGDSCLGYQIWTYDSDFIDLKKIGIRLNKDEAYLFDLFVFPKFRGTDIPKMICTETFNYLVSQGIKKIYGFYYLDNIKALWWHRAYLKCREIGRIPTSRFFLFEFTRGKLYLNL